MKISHSHRPCLVIPNFDSLLALTTQDIYNFTPLEISTPFYKYFKIKVALKKVFFSDIFDIFKEIGLELLRAVSCM